MSLKWFGSRRKSVAEILPEHMLQVDLHSHLISGIDDGAQSETESLQMLQGLVDRGYRKAITTPHIMQGSFQNNSSTIEEGLKRLQALAGANSLNLELEAAAEYYCDEFFRKMIAEKDVLTFGKRHVLFEFPMHTPPSWEEEIIFELNVAGYQPVLAHPERYGYFMGRGFEKLSRLKDLGVQFQLNLFSLGGFYTTAIEEMALQLMELSMYEWVGSDLHKPRQLERLSRIFKNPKFIELMNSGNILNNSLL
jgi:tyrosine-protein phosphatase YwqE